VAFEIGTLTALRTCREVLVMYELFNGTVLLYDEKKYELDLCQWFA
jgi:hypothetical protein